METQTEKDAAKYPTGYTSSALPFYSDLDDQKFEQFCTDLLNLHPVITLLKDGKATQRRIGEATRLLAGNDQKGADIRAKDDQGAVWFFQCKRTQSFVKSQVCAAIELLEKGYSQAGQYVLVTACGLSAEAQEPIYGRPNWLWWDSSRLTIEVQRLRPREEAINLVHRIFGSEWAKRLFPCSDQPLLKWREFFQHDLVATNKHFRHTIPFVPWGDALSKLEEFAQTGAGRALVLSAAGGQGKSRLLLELAQRLEKQPLAPRVRFLNLNQHGLSGEQSDFLAREEGDLLLIVDDAHRLGAAIEDVARPTEKVKSIRLLIATRPQAVDAITSQLYQNGYAENRFEEPLRLPRWQREDICTLAERILAPEHRMQASNLAALADDCPLLVVLGADLVNSGQHLAALPDEQAFRKRVFKSFKDDFLQAQPEAKRERLSRVISFLSFISPTRKNQALLDDVADILGCSPLDIDEDLGALETAGLVVENREGIRLYPDLFADAVLLDACLDRSNRPSQLHKTVLDKLKLRDFPALIRNVAQADWESRSRYGVSDSLFDPIWHKFIKDFRAGRRPQGEDDFVEHWFGVNPSLRAVMLEWWEPIAVFLPDRTLELARLAIDFVTVPSDGEWACRNIPPILKSIVECHKNHAIPALDLLWKLATFGTEGNNEFPFAAITSIAEAASFAPQKKMEVTELVLSWLERKLQDPAAMQFLRHPKWVISALLKPFFVREVQGASYPGKGNTVIIETLRLRAEKVRPIRQRVLAIIEKFLKSPDTMLGCAVVPVLAEAIKPAELNAKADQESWRQDCLDVFKVIEGAVKARQDSPTLLLQLRGVLRNRRQIDRDSVLRGERDRVLKTIPDTFELRVNLALTSFAHMEFPCQMNRDQQWAEFTHSVATEALKRCKTAHNLCEFLWRAVDELNAVNENPRPAELLQQMAQVSPTWCASLLKELVGTADPALDRGLWPVIQCAATNTPEAYREAVESLPTRGRPAQLCELISFLGWKQIHGGGLAQFERDAVLSAVNRSEESVVCELAILCGHRSGNKPKWAMDVLSQLRPGGERSGDAIMDALGFIVREQASHVESQKVAECLGNMGEYCFQANGTTSLGLTRVAQRFPKQVYEHVRRLCELAESDSAQRPGLCVSQIPSLGPLGDAEYVDREIHALWNQAAKYVNGGFSREFRLALIRSLMWADAATALDRIRNFVAACKNADEIKLLAELVGTRPSRFVFDHPDVVRAILALSQEFAAINEVTNTLLLSACGGSRTYTDSELDPEYKYILEQGDALANRHRDDSLLSSFYRAIADSERRDLECRRQGRKGQDY